MTDDTTRLINNTQAQNQHSQQNKHSKIKNVMTATVTGMVAGGASGATITAVASTSENDIISPEECIGDIPETPMPGETILANDEGIRYAHVDADNFNDAFAQARQQLGAEGVFEYNGRLYGTYYADEWAKMSPQQRADYQHQVNGIASAHDSEQPYRAEASNSDDGTHAPTRIPANAEMISDEPTDNEIKVISIDSVEAENGEIMNIALVEYEGENALLVDVDNNGQLDILIHDDNHDGGIQDSEIHDISSAGICINDLIHTQAMAEGDLLYASNDDLPDYVNDADSIMIV